jgi:hypothetical protein
MQDLARSSPLPVDLMPARQIRRGWQPRRRRAAYPLLRATRLPRRVARFGVTIALATGLAACETRMVAAPSADLRAQLGEIGVDASGASPMAPAQPISDAGDAALYGAGQGTEGAFSIGGGACKTGDAITCLFGLALSVAVLPVATAIGAGMSAGRTHDVAEVAAADEVIRRAIDETHLAARIEQAVMEAGRRVPGLAFVTRTLPDPIAAHEAAPANPPWRLALRVTGAGFASEGQIEPDATLYLTLRAEILQTDTGQTLYWRSWAYRSREHGYFDLAHEDGALLRRELAMAARVMGERIVTDLFVATEPVKLADRTGEPGTAWTIDGPLLDTGRPSTGSAATRSTRGVARPFWMEPADPTAPQPTTPILPRNGTASSAASPRQPTFIGPINREPVAPTVSSSGSANGAPTTTVRRPGFIGPI